MVKETDSGSYPKAYFVVNGLEVLNAAAEVFVTYQP
jgi:hypothetical protein